MPGRNAVQEVMSEPCLYGGLLATRHEVYEDLRESAARDGAKLGTVMLDRLVWMAPSISPEEAHELSDRGMTLANFRAHAGPFAGKPGGTA